MSDNIKCTGITASWCPVHGDCTCPRKIAWEREEEDPRCPLHSLSSDHADFELNDRGFIKLHCPYCGSEVIETTAMAVTERYDPNTKRCNECNYIWRQLEP